MGPEFQEEGRGCLGLHCKRCVEGPALGKSRSGFEVPTWGWDHGAGVQAAYRFLLAFPMFEEGLPELRQIIRSSRCGS